MQIAVGNGVFYGGGTKVAAEGATIDDGHLDLYSLEMRTVWKLALMLRSVPLRRARRLVGGAHRPRHRVRGPHAAADGRSTPTAS